MRIALFTDSYAPQVNGVARTLERLVAHARARGHEVALVVPRLASVPAAADMAVELPSIPVPLYPELRLALPPDRMSLARLCAFRPDLVHVATEATLGRAGLAFAAQQRVPLVSSFHTDFPAYLAGYGLAGLERALWLYLRSFHRRAAITFCPSRATLLQLRREGFDHDVRIWSRGVDSSLFSPYRRRESVRRALAHGAAHLLVYVGRVAPEKRLDLLLDAFRDVRSAEPGAALVIVGDGPMLPELQRRNEAGVHFTGYRTGAALAEAYAAADVFVFPSDTETFGNVVLEAAASGVAVVAPARGGVTDTVQHGVTGLLVPPGDSRAFAAATLRLLRDDALRVQLGARGRAAALERSWDGILDDVLAGYSDAAGAAGIPRVA